MSPWFAATRPKTLPAGVVPVLVGTALAAPQVVVSWPLAAGAALGSLLIQIGCNFANEVFDARRGADGPDRQGPTRAVAAGLISPRAMLVATAVVLLLALAVGLWLAAAGGWPILVLGMISLVCAIAYTGGPYPLAYHGLGDLFVLVFFGLFAVLGSAWLQVAHSPGAGLSPGWWCVAAAVGLQATAILCINNLRDIASDGPVGKRTLCVRMGDRLSRWYYLALHAAAAAAWMAGGAWATSATRDPYVLAAGIAGIGGLLLARAVFTAQGAALNRFLAFSALLELATGTVFSAMQLAGQR